MTMQSLIQPHEDEVRRRMLRKLRAQKNPMLGVKRLPGRPRTGKKGAGKPPLKGKKLILRTRMQDYLNSVGEETFTVARMADDLGITKNVASCTIRSQQVADLIEAKGFVQVGNGRRSSVWGRRLAATEGE